VTTEMRDGQITTHYYGMSMPMLATSVSNEAGRPVQDKTGLTGRYDMTMQRPVRACAPHCGPQDSTVSADDPLIFSMVERLGLKLEPGKGQVETLVVDHIERPSEN
jgi:bla regulator protein blaR1